LPYWRAQGVLPNGYAHDWQPEGSLPVQEWHIPLQVVVTPTQAWRRRPTEPGRGRLTLLRLRRK
ncbi:hypothetical protein AUM95_22875, partial [Cronobacter sakazakii]